MSSTHIPEDTVERSTSGAQLDLTLNADAQSGSPLFAAFPPEIRAEIFALALCPFPNEEKAYPFDSYWYRPGYTAPRKLELALLGTCKRVHQEAKALVWKEGTGNEQEAFWWGSNERRPPECRGPSHETVFDEEFELDGIWDEEPWDESWGSDEGDEAAAGGSGERLDHEVLEDAGHQGEAIASPAPQEPVDPDPSEQTDSAPNLSPMNAPAVLPEDAQEDPRERHIKQFISLSLYNIKKWHHDSPSQCPRQKAFTSTQWSKLRTIDIFPQMYAFSSRAFIRTFVQAEGLRPSTVKVTIRYTDWWNWEVNAPLDLASLVPELDAYYFPESVDSLILELESAEHKKGELEAMVKEVVENKKRWTWKRLDDECLELDEGVGVKEWEWMGTTRFGGQQFAHHPEGDTMKYLVKVLTFTAKPTQVKWDGTPFDRALAIKNYEASIQLVS